MLKVAITGFQSIESISFSIDGFTALVGRSNIGKSAIVRAIQAALTNALGTDFVRHGEFCSRRTRGTKKCKCQCSVHLETDGLDLLWEKGDEINQYTFNGEVYSSMDRGFPEFLVQDFDLVKVGDKKQLIQVAVQSEPIFLLNQPGTVVADVLADVAKLDEINLAMSDAEKDRKEANSILKVRERDVLDLTVALGLYEGLDEPVQQVKTTRQLFDAMESLCRQQTELNEFHERLRELGQGIRFLQPMEAIEIPDVEPVGASEKGLAVLLRYEEEFEAKTLEVAFLEPVEPLAEPDASPLETSEAVIGQLIEWLSLAADLKAALIEMREVEATKELSDPPQGADEIVRITGFEGQYQVLSAEVEELESVELTSDPEEPVQDIHGLLSIAGFSEQHIALTDSISTLETTLSEVEVQEAAVLEEWRDLGMCPTCSQTITEDHQIHFDA